MARIVTLGTGKSEKNSNARGGHGGGGRRGGGRHGGGHRGGGRRWARPIGGGYFWNGAYWVSPEGVCYNKLYDGTFVLANCGALPSVALGL